MEEGSVSPQGAGTRRARRRVVSAAHHGTPSGHAGTSAKPMPIQRAKRSQRTRDLTIRAVRFPALSVIGTRLESVHGRRG